MTRRTTLFLLLACAVGTSCGNSDDNANGAETKRDDTRTQSEPDDAAPASEKKSATEKPKSDDDKAPADHNADAPSSAKSDTASAQPDSDSSFCGVLDVARSNCQQCHAAEPVAGAPMPLVKYEDFVASAVSDPSRKVFELVQERVHDAMRPMPPAPGKLTAAALTQLDAWVSAGALQAAAPCPNVEQAAPTTTVAESDFEWPADCEEHYTFVAHDRDDPAKPYVVPADTEEHPSFDFDAPWGDDDVQMLAERPITDNAKVLHHWILWDAVGGTSLQGWAPGGIADKAPSDVGIYLPKGAKTLSLDLHYYNRNGGEAAPDRSGIEICVTHKLRPKTAATMGLNGSAVVKAMSRGETPVSCNVTTDAEVHLLHINPHMHQLGVHAKLELTRDGATSAIWDAPFSFNEQEIHPLDNIMLRTGDVLTTTCTFMNDRPTDVKWGESTEDEMCINWVRYYPKDALHCARPDMMKMSSQ